MKAPPITTVLIAGALLTISTLDAQVTCYEYPMDHFTIIHEHSNQSGDIKKEILDPKQYRFLLAVPEKLNQLKHHTFFLYHGDKMLEYNAMECYDFRGTTGGYECQGECDSGHLIVAADHALRSKEGVMFGESVDDSDGDWYVRWHQPGQLIDAHETACPVEIKSKLPNDKGYDKEYIKTHAAFSMQAYQNVCYSTKEMRRVRGKWQPLYGDCEINRQSCDEMGMQRFGHYQNEAAARAALDRCQHSISK